MGKVGSQGRPFRSFSFYFLWIFVHPKSTLESTNTISAIFSTRIQMFPFRPLCKLLSNSLWRLQVKSNFCWVVYEWKALKYCCCIALYQDCKWDFSFGARWAYTRPMRWSSSNFLWKAHSYTLQYKGPRVVFWSLKSLKKVTTTMMSTRTIWSISSCKTLFIRCKLTPRLLRTQTKPLLFFICFLFWFFHIFYRSKIRLFLWLLFWPEN